MSNTTNTTKPDPLNPPKLSKPRPPVLSVGLRDAAGVLGLSHRTIQGMVQRGELPSFKVGDRRLLSVAELRRWVDRQAASGGQGGAL
jgi:excisionase family DNA binding protein